jgi:precorrin-2/cobalt-factor-2 C20-methyltransferase
VKKRLVGKVVGIGVGPGDPELITIKAAKMLRAADVICVPKAHADIPSMALGMIKQVLHERKILPVVLHLVFPMTKDEKKLNEAWAKNAEIVATRAKRGETVAFITLGDPMFYSTFVCLCQAIKAKFPEVPLEIIPGVTSLTACAATARLPLAEQNEALAIIPTAFDPKQIGELAKNADNLVLMKGVQRVKDLIPILEKAGFREDSTVALVRRSTLPEENVTLGKFADVKNWDIHDDYFSMVIIKKAKLNNCTKSEKP